jgi:hypothetical protein
VTVDIDAAQADEYLRQIRATEGPIELIPYQTLVAVRDLTAAIQAYTNATTEAFDGIVGAVTELVEAVDGLAELLAGDSEGSQLTLDGEPAGDERDPLDVL